MEKISSLQNPLIKDLAKLDSKKEIIKQQRFYVEGRNIIKELLEKDRITFLLVTDETMYQEFKIRKILVPKEIIQKISDSKTNRGSIGIVPYCEEEDSISNYKKIVVLDGINNPLNLGAIIRSCKAFNIDAVALLNDSTFKYIPKVIRTSQGNVLDYPVLNITEEDLEGYNTYLLMKSHVSKSILDTEISSPTAFVFGNESNGISKTLISKKYPQLHIPINDKVESLNISIAVSIVSHFFNK